MYQGYFTQFVESVKTDVERGVLSKEEAVTIILGKAQEILSDLASTAKIDKKQFMLDRMAEAQEVN